MYTLHHTLHRLFQKRVGDAGTLGTALVVCHCLQLLLHICKGCALSSLSQVLSQTTKHTRRVGAVHHLPLEGRHILGGQASRRVQAVCSQLLFLCAHFLIGCKGVHCGGGGAACRDVAALPVREDTQVMLCLKCSNLQQPGALAAFKARAELCRVDGLEVDLGCERAHHCAGEECIAPTWTTPGLTHLSCQARCQ